MLMRTFTAITLGTLLSLPALSALAETATYYGPGFHGQRTASGEIFNQWDHTAAHPNLPFGTRVRVTNPRNGRSVVVRINDRKPSGGIDLSTAAAQVLGIINSGWANVRLQILQ